VNAAGAPLDDHGRVALVHDWLTGYRGGEKVLDAIAGLSPRADLYTLIHVPGSTRPTIENRRVRASWLNRLPGVEDYYRWLLPFFPGWIDRLDLSDYDLVLSTSHCVAKGARAAPGAVHVCYCHTPMRYVWDRFDDYFGHWTGPRRWLIEREAARLRHWDRETVDRVDRWIANSHFVRDRILRFYEVDPDRVEVVVPPVDVERFRPPEPAPEREDRYLAVSALVPYKRIDHAVEACARTGRRLDVAGTGPEEAALKARVRDLGATDRIRFLGFVPDDELPGLMARRRAFLFPGIEDFGITPVESTAAGLPVVARGVGGVLDSVRDGENGVLYEGGGAEALEAALDDFEARGDVWDRRVMWTWAEGFAEGRFVERYVDVVARAIADEGPKRTTGRDRES